MARKNMTDLIGGSAQGKPRPAKYFTNTTKYFKAISPPPFNNKQPAAVAESETTQYRVASSPKNIPSSGKPISPRVSPRTSPGLMGRHYAGCKFSEPPAPTTLPLPPQHWTLTSTSASTRSRHVDYPVFKDPDQQHSLSQQLKVLLKVQG